MTVGALSKDRIYMMAILLSCSQLLGGRYWVPWSPLLIFRAVAF